MQRDLEQLASRTFDVLVVGGGVYGLAVAYDAAQRGLSTALVERDDFGGGASFNHLRTIHGGLRYLQTFDIARARESLRERRTLARIAPHAVQPLRFILPLERSLTRGPLALRAAFAVDRIVAFDRNAGVPPPLRLPPGRVLTPDEAVREAPILREIPMVAAAAWYDYETTESDRLTFAYAVAAAEHGAVLANYVEAQRPIVDGGRVAVRGGRVAVPKPVPPVRVSGFVVGDRQTGRSFDVAARVIVNATGSAAADVAGVLGAPLRLPLLKAMNLVTRREAHGAAIGARSRSGRHLFLVPWRGRALFGTWESPRTVDASAVGVSEEELSTFVAELNDTFPSLALSIDEISLVHRGVVPAVIDLNGRVALEGHERIHDHAVDGVEGMITVVGTKYTTARSVAQRITDRVVRKLARAAIPCRTGTTPLGNNHATPIPDALSTTASAIDLARHLTASYGRRGPEVMALTQTEPELATRVAADSPVTAAELRWAVREEMALTLPDVVIRRTPLGALGCPADDVLQRAAAIVSAETGWSEERQHEEIAAVKRFYSPVTR